MDFTCTTNKNQSSGSDNNNLHTPMMRYLEIESMEKKLKNISKEPNKLNSISKYEYLNFHSRLHPSINVNDMWQELEKSQPHFFSNPYDEITGPALWQKSGLYLKTRNALPETKKLVDEGVASSSNVDKDAKMNVTFLLKTADLDALSKDFEIFHAEYSKFFQTKTRNVSKQAKQYTQGLIFNEGHGNMVEFAKKVPHSNSQSLQHLVSNSPWDDKALTTKIQNSTIELIGDEEHGSLHLDEKAFPKKGYYSVGVQRQYDGNMGKVDNCQVGVLLSYLNTKDNGYFRSLIDKRLYIPKAWA